MISDRWSREVKMKPRLIKKADLSAGELKRVQTAAKVRLEVKDLTAEVAAKVGERTEAPKVARKKFNSLFGELSDDLDSDLVRMASENVGRQVRVRKALFQSPAWEAAVRWGHWLR